MVICNCNYIKEKDIEELKEQGVKTIDEVSQQLEIDWCCCKCLDEIEQKLK